MKRYVNNAKGLSLLELLAAVTISSIILASMYGVLLSGINTYKRIGVENELRSEADYAVAMVMNELYQFSPDGLDTAASTPGRIRFVNNRQKRLDPNVGWVEEHETDGLALTIELKDEALFINEAKISSDRLKIVSNQSKLSFSCARQEGNICRSGIVTFVLAVQDRDHENPDEALYIEPFTLKTEFGF